MPLSEHEQRQLEQIEEGLYTDYPKLRRPAQSAGRRMTRRQRRREWCTARTKRIRDWAKTPTARNVAIVAGGGFVWGFVLWMLSMALQRVPPGHHFPLGLWAPLLILNGAIGGYVVVLLRKLNAALPTGQRLGWTARTRATAAMMIFIVLVLAAFSAWALLQY